MTTPCRANGTEPSSASCAQDVVLFAVLFAVVLGVIAAAWQRNAPTAVGENHPDQEGVLTRAPSARIFATRHHEHVFHPLADGGVISR